VIIGLGNDIADIRRIERTLKRFGSRFERRVFTPAERQLAHRRRHRAATYAKRFAAKEACAKALGTGLRKGVFWRDMEVIKARSGAPSLRLTGGAARRLAAITPPASQAQITLSLTDEYPLAHAIVVIMAIAQS